MGHTNTYPISMLLHLVQEPSQCRTKKWCYHACCTLLLQNYGSTWIKYWLFHECKWAVSHWMPNDLHTCMVNLHIGEGDSCYLLNHLFSNRIHHCSYIQSRLIVLTTKWLWWLVACAVLCINLLLLPLHTGSSWIPSMPWQGKVPKTLQVHASSSSLCFATDINVD